MRLSNVAHLRLPFGRLRGLDVAVARTGTTRPLSFDQARHAAGGDRPGSWMAISFTLPGPVDPDRLAAAWLAVIARHGTLRTVLAEEQDGLVLHEVAVTGAAWREHPIGPGQAVHEALQEVLDATCTPLAAPAHRLCLLETVLRPTVVLAADHAHVDMWSMLVLLRDLLAALDGAPPADGAPAFWEHTEALRDRPAAPPEVHRRWAEVLGACGDVMPRFPLPLGESGHHPERVEVRDVLDADGSEALAAQARADGVSTLSEVVSAMTAITRDLVGAPLRAVFPVHSRHEARWHDAVGWFIANSVLESTDPDPRACAAAVKEAVRLGSWPLAEVMAPWGGMPEAPGMFAVSWLDLRRLPVQIDTASLEAQYVGARTRPDGVMLWFVLDASGLHLRCRYPDTDQARRGVGGWLDALVLALRERADSSVRGRLEAGGRTYRVRRARREDVPALVALLADDELGAAREDPADLDRYWQVLEEISRDRTQLLAVVTAPDGRVVGTEQLTILPGLSRGATTRLQIEAVRVARSERSRGLGAAMIEWAHAHGRARGATLAQLTTDVSRPRAHAFYERLGYVASHRGYKRSLEP